MHTCDRAQDADYPAAAMHPSLRGPVSLAILAACACTHQPAASTSSPSSPALSQPAVAPAPAAASGSASAAPPASPPAPATASPAALTPSLTPFPLPSVTAPAALDYLAYDRTAKRVWVPEGTSGSVAVFDPAAKTFARVTGFASAEREVRGKKRAMGPSAVSIGEGHAYVGDRASGEVCPVDTATLAAGTCLKLPAPTDGVDYVAATKEVWVTVPSERALVVLDASRPAMLTTKARIVLDGSPEGYASDAARGLFFTNLEDRDRTVAIDLATRKPRATWAPGCGSDGPRGLADDADHGLLFVACTDHVVVLDVAHGGAKVASLDVGPGVDNIDWVPSRRQLFVAAGRAPRAVVATVDDAGRPTVVASTALPAGARNGVADDAGKLYLADPQEGALLVWSGASTAAP